ncbi:hypothetical protein Q9966_016464 [Columba livia]|nr:hypothetical protein Q9966_016464 [Columba livia]
MKMTRDSRDVIGLSIILLLLLVESGNAVSLHPDSSLDPRPPARMGDGQVPSPFVSLLNVSPPKRVGDGKRSPPPQLPLPRLLLLLRLLRQPRLRPLLPHVTRARQSAPAIPGLPPRPTNQRPGGGGCC